MISGLQEDFGDLGIKYPKQNISKCRSEHQISKAKYLKMSVAHIGKLQQNTVALCKMVVKLSGWALLADPDMSDQGSWNALLSHPDMSAGCETSGEDGTSPGQNSGCGISVWNVGGEEFRMWEFSFWWKEKSYPEQLHPDSSSGHATLANITHPDDSISYPDMALAIITPGR